ncbi:5127_t:CDS:2 [Entrophospora sp. SA101]|nr:5127_t:CDS:2 [Entrophospora sp. SA101]
MEERTIRSKKEQKMEKFREILKESEKFKDYSMFRNISKRFLCDQTRLCSFDARSAANSSHDVEIIKSIHQKLRDYQQETHKEIRFVLFNLLDDDGLLRHLKEIEKLCFLYFLMIDYVFGYIHLSKNDNKNVAIEIKDSTSNDTFIEIDIELVIISRTHPDPYGTFHKSIDGHFSPHSYQSEIDKLQVEFSKNQSQSTDNLCF